jgi:chromosome segregation ATPase
VHSVIDLSDGINVITGANGSKFPNPVRSGATVQHSPSFSTGGKSAIQAALVLALGGKAKDTERATTLAGLIRQGEKEAKITVYIRNKGDEAYRHNVFGDYIRIIRTIRQKTSYLIQDEFGRSMAMIASSLNILTLRQFLAGNTPPKSLVATYRNELLAMLDHFSLDPQNPIIFLPQEKAKTFLAKSTPESRYLVSLLQSTMQCLLIEVIFLL